jgi:hypothetical protein
MKTLFALSLALSAVLVFLSIVGLVLFSLNRAQTVILLTKWLLGEVPVLAATPVELQFTDLGGLTVAEIHYIELARTLGITAGTAPGKFDPYSITPFWQWSILYGKTAQAIKVYR